jgi:hypothetical protein
MNLVRIEAKSERSYVVTLVEDNGDEKRYEFTVRAGFLPVIEASAEFGEEVGSFGRSDLVYKVVNAFHAATQEKYGRPS